MSSGTLKRILGREPTSDHRLVLPWSEHPADPNGYYERLDITRHPASMGAIQKGYRTMARKHHPDSTDEPDDERFDLVQIAYEVLSNPDTRRMYDALSADDKWLDRREAEQQQRQDWQKLREQVPPEDLPDAIEEYQVRKAVDRMREDGDLDHLKPLSDHIFGTGFKFFYDTEEPPDDEFVARWVFIFAAWFWAYGEIRRFAIGFTDGSSRIEHREWGLVPMVSGEPNGFLAAYLVGEVVRIDSEGSSAQFLASR